VSENNPTPAELIEQAFAHAEADGCPITTVGKNDGVFYILAADGELRAIPESKIARNTIVGLFGRKGMNWVRDRFPIRDENGNFKDWRVSAAAEWLTLECVEAGVVDPDGLVRGVGVWEPHPTDPIGGLIWHCGDTVLADGAEEKPGKIGHHIYPLAPPRPRPGKTPMTRKEGEWLLQHLGRWNWRDPASPRLALGWLVAALVPGVIDWRPHVWISGDRQTGKTTLLKSFRALLAEDLLNLAETTEAAVRGALGRAARPVAVDEIESDVDNEKAVQVVKLARLASSRGGGMIGRGTKEGGARLSTLETVFLFSSINRPPLQPQDLQRITVLELESVKPDPVARAELLEEQKRLAALAPALRRRVIERWGDFADTLAMMTAALVARGHGTRAAEQLGHLLALGELLLDDELPDGDHADFLAEMFDPQDLADRLDDQADHERLIARLITSALPLRRAGGEETVGAALKLYLAYGADDAIGLNAHARLKSCGLAVRRDGAEQFLAVSNSHHQLARLFDGTHWQARSGSSGGWVQSLRRVPGAKVIAGQRFGAVVQRATLIPLSAVPLADDNASATQSATEEGDDFQEF
jgi:putative DNA primase/helicase